VTVATLVDRLKINGSLARRCLKDLEEKGQIKQVVGHSKMKIYSTFARPWCSLAMPADVEDLMLTTGLQLAPSPPPSKSLAQKNHIETDLAGGNATLLTTVRLGLRLRAWLRLWDWDSLCSSVGVA